MKGRRSKIIFLILFVFCSGQMLWSQNASDSNYFLKALRVNSGFSYISNSNDEYHNHREITWSNQVSISITSQLSAGVQVSSVYTWGTRVPKENFFLRGVFAQYDFIKNHKAMAFLELNYLQGDYCTCRPDDPYRKSGLHYIGFGPGIDYPILGSNFYGSASILIHTITNDYQWKYGYNIYKLGLSYRFGKPKTF